VWLYYVSVALPVSGRLEETEHAEASGSTNKSRVSSAMNGRHQRGRMEIEYEEERVTSSSRQRH
jgi:hypothetical protein